jgi:hypothetical protein
MDNQKSETPKDKILANYLYEMNNDGNDGWTKQHYKDLYDKRVADLEKVRSTIKNYIMGNNS